MKSSIVQAPSIYQKWVRFYRKHQMAVTLWLLFFLSIAVRTALASGMKLVSTYNDELLYYNVAENLARNHTFTVYYVPHVSENRVVYPLLLSPAFLLSSREKQFLLIALINSLLVSSGMWPVFLLSRNVLQKDGWTLLTVILYLLLPDMALTGTFMADLCLLPEALWLIWLGYQLMGWSSLIIKDRILYLFSYIAVLLVSIYTKKTSILFLPALLLACIYYSISQMKKNKQPKEYVRKRILGLVVVFAIGTIMSIIIAQKVGVWYAIVGFLRVIQKLVCEDITKYASYMGYFVSQIVIAGCVFPIVFPVIYHKQYDNKGTRLFILMEFLLFILLLGESRTQADGTYVIERAHLRYFTFIWAPYLVLFFKSMQNESFCWNIRSIIGWGVVLCWTASLFLWYRGPQKGSAVDYTMLYAIEEWNNHWSVYSTVFAIFVLGIFQLVLFKKKKIVFLGVLGCWLLVQLYNNCAATASITKDYACSPQMSEEISITEEFISNHQNATFLLLSMYDSDYAWARRLSDTFLNYPNVVTYSYKAYAWVSNNLINGYNLEEYPFTTVQGDSYETDAIDYIVVPTGVNACLETSKCKMVEQASTEYFQIIQVFNSKDFPVLSSFTYLLEDINMFSADCGAFFSEYKNNDEMLFTSSEEVNKAVLYGPYCTLQPGDYIVTVYIRDDSGTVGETIAMADVVCDTMKLVDEMTKVTSGETSVTFKFSTDKVLEQFQCRLYALQKGVTPVNVIIDYTAKVEE